MKTVEVGNAQYLLPEHVPDSMAEEMGVPIGILLTDLYPREIAPKIVDALAERNIKTYDDIIQADNALIRQAFQQVYKLEILRLKDYAKKELDND